MTTVGALIDRTYRLILEPPDAQPASTRLNAAITDSAVSVPLTAFDIPEDELLLHLGSIIEVDQEMMRVTNYDTGTRVATVMRGMLGTEKAAHLINAQVKLSPPFPRVEVFTAVRDNIVQLYPDLWTVRTEVIGAVGDAYPLEDPLAVEVVEVNPDSSYPTVRLEGRIVDTHPRTGGRAFILSNGQGPYNALWLRYRRRFGVAADETTTLESLGIEPSWEQLVMVSAAADLMAGRDVQSVDTDWVGNVLDGESIRVGTRLSVAGGLAQYRDILIARYRKEMRGEDSNKPRIRVNEVFV